MVPTPEDNEPEPCKAHELTESSVHDEKSANTKASRKEAQAKLSTRQSLDKQSSIQE